MERYEKHSARIAPAPPPLPTDIQQAIDAVMRGNTPLVLFTTLARDRRLFFKFFSSGLLDRGHLTIRQREIVIDRVTAACGARRVRMGSARKHLRGQGWPKRGADRIADDRRAGR
jgi:hypothetical protein